MYMAIGGFILCSLIILYAGKKLSYYGDLIAQISGLDKGWIGLILMATVTSLPEVFVGISSVVYVKSADLAVGNVLGSCVCNLALLSIIDFYLPKNRPIFGQATQSHILSASLGTILISLAGLGIFLKKEWQILPEIGLISISFMVFYLLSVRIVYAYNKLTEQNTPSETSESQNSALPRLQKVILIYAFFAIIIVVAAIFLPDFANRIAEHTGLGKTFVGTLFLAVSTNLPEIAVSVAAVRARMVDMAIGNLLGSNIFNIFIIFLEDLFYKGPMLLYTSSNHLISVFFSVVMGCVVIISLMFKPDRKKYVLGLDTFLILIMYVINLFLLFQLE
jgi:cation:H+ antiporter